MSALIDRYWTHYGSKKLSADREKSVLDGIRTELGNKFARKWTGSLSGMVRKPDGSSWSSASTAIRHFNVMHHMMGRPPRSGRRKPASTGIRLTKSKSGVLTIHVIAIYRPRNFKA